MKGTVKYLPTAIWATLTGSCFVARRYPALSDKAAAEKICATLFRHPARLCGSVVVVEAGSDEWRFELDDAAAAAGVPDGTSVTPESAEAVVVVAPDPNFDFGAFPDE